MIKYLFIALCGSLCILSCTRQADPSETRKVFRYNEATGISSLDPAFAKDLSNLWAVNQLFNGLVQLNDHLEAEPCIAHSWEITEGGTVYTFHLRDDVRFHDHPVFEQGRGRTVTAADFEYSFRRIVDPGVASPGAWVFQQVATTKDGPSFTALDDTTFRIVLSQPFPPFPGLLCMQYCSVVPREAVEHFGPDFRRNPVGTGPFQFSYWKEGVKLVMVKNPKYFEIVDNQRLPYLDAVAVTFLIDKQSAFLEFVKGNLDFLSGLDPGYKDHLITSRGELNPDYADRFTMLTMPYLNTEYLGFLLDTASASLKTDPYQTAQVRQAMNLGFDRVKMIRYLRNNIGTPGIYGIIPPGMPSFDSSRMTGYAYDPAKARQLLIDAGYPNGEGLPVITLSTTPDYVDLCKFIQSQLADIGIRLRIDVTPSATIREMKAQAKLPMFRASWIADYPDEENYLSLFYSKNFCPAGPNYTHFAHPEYDALYEKALQEENDSLRRICYQQMNHLMMQQSPVIILYYDRVLRFIQKNVGGIGINPTNLLTLKYVTIQ
ncbi:MAG: ABC transporter substrate-binding protein [Bacteroidales bacterium]|nr:ABC transporter substrate-binding protein [Lentimicrobiaceae bacterium]MDD5695292.1 ABC transporter substrate-binding protein [Bacteroidales bacterium]